jgi:hypothetical protein
MKGHGTEGARCARTGAAMVTAKAQGNNRVVFHVTEAAVSA